MDSQTISLSAQAARLSALEAKVTSLETENLLLKRALLSAPSSAPTASKKASSTAAGEKKAHAGPVAWNEEVLSVWMDMATEAGIDVSEEDWRKQALALGISRTEAMQEASRRRGPKPETPAKKVSTKPAAPSLVKAATPSLLKKAPTASLLKKGPAAAAAPASPAENPAKAEFESMGLSEIEIEGTTYYTSTDGEVFLKAGDYILGERVGMMTPEGAIDTDA